MPRYVEGEVFLDPAYTGNCHQAFIHFLVVDFGQACFLGSYVHLRLKFPLNINSWRLNRHVDFLM